VELNSFTAFSISQQHLQRVSSTAPFLSATIVLSTAVPRHAPVHLAGMVFVAGKTVWSMPENFEVVCIPCKALYKCSAFTLVAVRYYSTSELAPCWKKKKSSGQLWSVLNFIITLIKDQFRSVQLFRRARVTDEACTQHPRAWWMGMPSASVAKWVSSFLTAHQHILSYSVPFIHSVLFTVW